MKKIKKIISTILIVISLLLVGTFIYVYDAYVGKNNHYQAKENQIKVACVGDSITYGHSIFNRKKNSYPAQLQELLGETYCVNNYGVSGYCVQEDADKPYMTTNDYKTSLEFKADVVVFMLGSNDAKAYNWKGEDEFEKDYTSLLNDYKECNPNAKIYLCTPATALEVSFNIEPIIVEKISDFVRNYASSNNYQLIDINNLTENRDDLFSNDSIHPNTKGAYEIAKEVARIIK